MQRRFVRTFSFLVVATILAVGAALAEDGDGRSWFAGFLEARLSTPDRQVTVAGLDGVFSANPTVKQITVADRQGVWLTLDDVSMAWNRAALLDRSIEIEKLSASQVTVTRKPVAPANAAGGEKSSSGGVSGPPLAIDLKSIALPKIVLAAPLAGSGAELTAMGSAKLGPEALSAELVVDRQDRAGTLNVNLRLDPKANVLAADVKLDEPAGGLIAEFLGLRDRPPVAVTLSGEGPLDKWGGTLEAKVGDRRVLAGGMSVTRVETAYRVAAEFSAALQSLVPTDYAMLLAGDSKLAFDFTRADDGSIAVKSATLRSDGVDLSASGALGPDMVPQSADLSLKLGQAGRAALPFAPGDVTVASLTVTAGLDAGGAAPWRATVGAEGVEGAFGRIAHLSLDATGQAQNLARASARSTSFRFNAAGDGIMPNDLALRDALGPTLKASGAGSWSAGQPVKFDDLNAILTGATANFAGTATGKALNGEFIASVIDLARFAKLAGRELAGKADIKASGSAARDGTFELTLDGTTGNLSLGVAPLDPLLAGATKVSGGVARDDKGLRFDHLALTNDATSAELNGSLSDPAIDMTVTANVADLSRVTKRAAGAAKLSAHVTGTRAAPDVEAEATGDGLVLMGRPLADAKARFSGVVSGPATSGQADISGKLGDAPVAGSAKLSAGESGVRRLDDLRLTVGDSQAAGSLTIGSDGLLSGKIGVVSADLSKVSPLFLVKASGMLRAEITLQAENGGQSAAFSGVATDVIYEDASLRSADVKGEAHDIFRAPKIEGKFALGDLTAGGLTIVTATGTAERAGDATAFSVDAALADGRAELAGNLAPQDAGLAIALKSFLYKRPGIDLALAEPTTITLKDGTANFQKTMLKASGGSIVISGSAGAALDLSASLESVPAALVNAFAPNLDAEGTISGVVQAKGSGASPNATFEITLAGASVAATRNAGVGPLGVSAHGTFADHTVNLSSEIFGADGTALQVGGTLGTAKGAPLNLKVTGGLPLALGNRQLASRGAALQGALNVDIAVSGTADAPRFSGRIGAEGGGFVDPETGVVLKDLTLEATVAGNQIVVNRLTATSGEGSLSATGSIGLDPHSGFPVDLAVQIRKARYVDGTLIAARFDADLTLKGSLSEGPLLEGKATLDRTEITVPEKLPKDSVAVDVSHVGAPPKVVETLAIVEARDSGASGRAGTRGGSGIRLNVAVNAPQRIFVRGRGLDAEFGGSLTLVGPLSALSASGGFQMVRGRLDILTQRIAFDRGVITFAGDLDPILEFSGSTRSGDVTVTVTVTGRASDPQVNFSSAPELPQDEILARLVFQKGLGELSPLQVARLAAAASELSGGSGGILGKLRATTGLDDLDIVTDEKGETSVAAGRYVTENVYVGVQQGTTTESSRVTIDLDVTKGLKARAGMSAEGNSSLGLFFEKEY